MTVKILEKIRYVSDPHHVYFMHIQFIVYVKIVLKSLKLKVVIFQSLLNVKNNGFQLYCNVEWL